MALGKAAVLVGGVVLVGVVGVAALGAPAQLDTNVPVGTFVIQMPTELFSGEAESPLVTAPELISQPDGGFIAMPQSTLVTEQMLETNRDIFMQAPDLRDGTEAMVASAAVTAQQQAESNMYAFGMCGAH